MTSDKKEKTNKEHNNTSSIYVLIISFLLIIIILLVAIIFLLKRDTSVSLPVDYSNVEEAEQLVVTEELKLDLSNKIYKLLGGNVFTDYTENNKYGKNKFDFNLLDGKLSDVNKQFISLSYLNAVKDDTNRWKEHNNFKNITSFDPTLSMVQYHGTISYDEYSKHYLELFGIEPSVPEVIVGVCPEYYYSDTYNEFYKITFACGSISFGSVISYISDYEITEEDVQVYISFGIIIPGNDDKTDIYGNFEFYVQDGERRVKEKDFIEKIESSVEESYKITDTNIDKFSQYKFVFKKKDNNYYYDNVIKIR